MPHLFVSLQKPYTVLYFIQPNCKVSHEKRFILYPTASPIRYPQWAGPRPKLLARNTTQVSCCVGGQGPSYLAYHCCLPGLALAGSCSQDLQWGIGSSHSDMGPGCLHCCAKHTLLQFDRMRYDRWARSTRAVWQLPSQYLAAQLWIFVRIAFQIQTKWPVVCSLLLKTGQSRLRSFLRDIDLREDLERKEEYWTRRFVLLLSNRAESKHCASSDWGEAYLSSTYTLIRGRNSFWDRRSFILFCCHPKLRCSYSKKTFISSMNNLI